jgi:hypothetical protein
MSNAEIYKSESWSSPPKRLAEIQWQASLISEQSVRFGVIMIDVRAPKGVSPLLYAEISSVLLSGLRQVVVPAAAPCACCFH